MSLLNVIAGNSYWVINKQLAKAVGVEAALLFSDLAQAQNYWNEKSNKYTYFFKVERDIEEDTTLSVHKQAKCRKKLIDAGILKTRRAGVPARLHYLIDKECLENLFNNILGTSSAKIKELDTEKLQNITKEYKTKEYNTNINNIGYSLLSANDSKEKEASPKKVAPKSPPKYKQEVLQVLEALQDLTGVSFRMPKDRQLEKYGAYKMVKARLEDGATVEEIKQVLSFKCKEWMQKDKMRQYCTYNTLLRKSNFEKYQNELKLYTNAKQTNNHNKQRTKKKPSLKDGLATILQSSSEKGLL